MTSQWRSYREPFLYTLARNGAIALAAGTLLTLRPGGRIPWTIAVILMLWPSFGGHWIELCFLNYLRPRLPQARAMQTLIRLVVWFIGGIGLAAAMSLTATALAGLRPVPWPALWRGGLVFIGIELAVHFVLQLRGRPSFYNGQG